MKRERSSLSLGGVFTCGKRGFGSLYWLVIGVVLFIGSIVLGFVSVSYNEEVLLSPFEPFDECLIGDSPICNGDNVVLSCEDSDGQGNYIRMPTYCPAGCSDGACNEIEELSDCSQVWYTDRLDTDPQYWYDGFYQCTDCWDGGTDYYTCLTYCYSCNEPGSCVAFDEGYACDEVDDPLGCCGVGSEIQGECGDGQERVRCSKSGRLVKKIWCNGIETPEEDCKIIEGTTGISSAHIVAEYDCCVEDECIQGGGTHCGATGCCFQGEECDELTGSCCVKSWGKGGTIYAEHGMYPASVCCKVNEEVVYNRGRPVSCCEGKVYHDIKKDGSLEDDRADCCKDDEIMRYIENPYTGGKLMYGCEKSNCCQNSGDCPVLCSDSHMQSSRAIDSGDERPFLFQKSCKNTACIFDWSKEIIDKMVSVDQSWLGYKCKEKSTGNTNTCGQELADVYIGCDNCGSYCKDSNTKVELSCIEDKCVEVSEQYCGAGEVCIEHKAGLMTAQCESCPESLTFVTNTKDHQIRTDDGHHFFANSDFLFISDNTFLGRTTPEEVFRYVSDVCSKCSSSGRKITLILENHGKSGIQGFGNNDGRVSVGSKYLIDNVMDKYNFDCLEEVVYGGCSVGEGEIGKNFIDISEDIFGVGNTHVYASSSTVVIRYDDEEDYGVLNINGGLFNLETIFYATREDLTYPGMDNIAYQTEIAEGHLNSKVKIWINSEGLDKIMAIKDDEMVCESVIILTEEFFITSDTKRLELEGLAIEIPSGAVSENEMVKLKINVLGTDCSRFEENYGYNTIPPTSEEHAEANSLYESGFISEQSYTNIKERFENNWECIEDSDCYGICPMNMLDCVFKCDKHECVAVDNPGISSIGINLINLPQIFSDNTATLASADISSLQGSQLTVVLREWVKGTLPASLPSRVLRQGLSDWVRGV